MRNDGVFDVIDLDQLLPGLKVECENGLTLLNALSLGLTRRMRLCRICLRMVN